MFGLRLGRKKVKNRNAVLRGLRLYMQLLLLGGAFTAVTTARADLPARAALPVPCSNSCSAMGGANGWITSGQASLSSSGSTLYVNQQSDKAILNWQSFNIGADSKVQFNQPATTSVALNRIYQADPSKIYGALNANGQVYLINRNGMIFGQGAKVDVGSLTASTLNIDNATFNTVGIIQAVNQGSPAFVAEGPMGSVVIESGAQIQTSEGGRVMVLAPVIENSGTINTPGGQTLLAASQDKVWLMAAGKDDNLRGLLVEVGTGGDVNNFGDIVAQRGNITMMGFAVNQQGILSASTTINSNGSIKLLARDKGQLRKDGSKYVLEGITTERDGKAAHVTFGNSSRTEVLPELNETTTAVDEQKQALSSVDVVARSILVSQGAEIVVPGGNVSLVATANPAVAAQAGTVRNDSRVVLESGSLIDVSGTTSTELAMERNLLQVELRANELADSPLQRDGVLRGKKVTIDIRKGTSIANIQGALDGIKRDVGERLAAGGSINVASEGDVVMAKGATVDISGGEVRYDAGWINTTKLTSEGKIYDIGSATPDQRYDGVLGEYNRSSNKWGVTQTWRILGPIAQGQYESGYVEGKDAGDFKVSASAMQIDGNVEAHVTYGVHQDNPLQLPRLGGLELDLATLGRSGIKYDPAAVSFATHTANSIGNELLNPSDAITIDPRLLQEGGVGRVTLRTNGEVTVPEGTDLRLPAGGELNLSGAAINLDGTITVRAGKVALNTVQTQGLVNRPLSLGEHARIDVSGGWVNEYELSGNDTVITTVGSKPWLIDGGSVTLSAQGDLSLAAGSEISADGGAVVDATGELHAGSGGDINLISRVPLIEGSQITVAGDLHAYAAVTGGSLSIEANSVRIDTAGDAAAGELLLTPEFFQKGGFKSYALTSNLNGITVADGSVVKPQAQTLQLDNDFSKYASGADIRGFSQLTLLPEAQRHSVDLSLTLDQSAAGRVTPALFRIGSAARIETGPEAKLILNSDHSIDIDGTLSTAGGQIALNITATAQKNGTADVFYRPEQGIHLGANAQLLTTGKALYTPNTLGQPLGEVLDGGQVSLTADRGHIVTEAGSLIDVSGTAAMVQIRPQGSISGGIQELIASDAGAIKLTAAEGMVLAGSLSGRAGAAQAAGGDLQVVLDGTTRDAPDVAPPAPLRNFEYSARTITLGSSAVQLPEGWQPGMALPKALNGRAEVNGALVQAGGFDTLTLRANDLQSLIDQKMYRGQINLNNADLNLRRSIVLDAPLINNSGGDSRLAAAYVALSDSGARGAIKPQAATGEGTLEVTAQQVDLIGNVTLQGWRQTRIASDGDMRMRGLLPTISSKEWLGSLNSFSDVQLQAARLYPSTLTQYQVNVTGPDGELHIAAAAQPVSGPLLSAGGKLTLKADNITQGGVVQAPFGEINMVAAKQLVLAPGSLTSTSAAGQVIPFGQTQLGIDWVFPINETNTLLIDTPPAQKISLDAPSVLQKSGAVIDLSGGGDLSAYEFAPGPGGSRDVLAPENSSNLFAIIPGLQGYGPYDPLAFTSSGLRPGDSIHLAAGSGLAAGDYLLLPARYALLPGAFLVTPKAGTQDFGPGQSVAMVDESVIVAGYRTVAGTNVRESRWSGYAVAPGAVAHNYSEYQQSLANQFYSDRAVAKDKQAPLLPRDAGQLEIKVSGELQLDGELRAQKGGQGRGARVDLDAQKLSVVVARGADDGTVQITADNLNALKAESLLLGGRRSESSDGTTLAVSATEVTVRSGAKVNVPELLLAAADAVTLESGAEVAASGEVAATGVTYLLQGDGALLQLSAGAPVAVERNGAKGVNGALNIAAGSTLSASGSMYLESSRDTVMKGALMMQGGTLNLSAKRITLGDAPQSTAGLVLSQQQLSGLHMDHLTLSSRETVDLYGTIDLNMKALTVAATGLIEHGDGADVVSITANTLTLKNSGSSATAVAVDDSATLNVTTADLRLEGGEFKIDGFAATALTANHQVMNAGNGRLSVDGDLTMKTPLVGAEYGADSTIVAGGKFDLLSLPAAAEGVTPSGLGARLKLSGSELTLATAIQLPSGDLRLHASSGDIRLLADAAVDVSGRVEKFADAAVTTPAGNVSLTADGGDVLVDRGAIIALKGVTGGEAGTLQVNAASGTLRLDGTVDAHDENGNGLATVNLDLGTLDDFSQLNRTLNNSGFGDGRGLRLRRGDITVATADVVQAQRLHLTADEGAIDVYGHINAAAAKGGEVVLQARDDLHLHSTARIDAQATAADQAGGHVVLATTKGSIAIDAADVADAAVIDVSGTRTAAAADLQYVGGKVELRAPRTANGVAVSSLAGNIKGAESIAVEAFKSYSATVLDRSLQNRVNSDTAAYMDNAADITTALQMQGDTRFRLRPGVEIDSTGSLIVTDSWDFTEGDYEGTPQWRYGGESGVLTLRAADQLVFNESVKDGIETADIQIYPDDPYSVMPLPGRLLKGDSWSFRFAGGADLSSADPLAVKAGKGSVRLGDGVQLHSGSGDIALASGGDLSFADSRAAIFSAGRSAGYGSLPMEWMAGIFPGQYPVRGGDVTLDVAGNIKGAGTDQLITDWLHRMGNFGEGRNIPTAWAVNFKDYDDQPLFKQNLGVFGGGNLSVHAGGNIDRLSAVVPTTGRPDGEYSGNFDNGFITNKVTELGGGGSLDVKAGGNINGGIYYVENGDGKISAGKSIQEDKSGVAPVFVLGDAKLSLQARDDLTLEAVLNSMVLPPSDLEPEGRGLFESFFFSYGDKSGIDLSSLSGDVTLRNQSRGLTKDGNFPNIRFGSNELFTTTIYPGDLSVAALQGNIYIDNSFTLFPSHNGNLELLADGNITMHGSTSQINVNMSDADPLLLPGSGDPVISSSLANSEARLQFSGASSLIHAAKPLHLNDQQSIEIVARQGSLRGSEDGAYALAFYLPKQAHLVAGKDIRDILFSGQNLSSQDVTLIEAGRDIAYSNRRGGAGQLAPSESIMLLSGPGQLVLRAGRTVDLGTSYGVVTNGNTKNLALDESGASVTVEAGMKKSPDFGAYLSHYIPLDAALRTKLIEAVRSTTGRPQLSESDALLLAAQLTQEQQRQLALPHFYAELAKASRLAAQSQNGADYQSGYDAIASLLGDTTYQGDLRLYFSRIQTLDGGDINLLVPGGLINAGLATTGGGFSKTPDQLGIVAVRSGDVNIYLDKDMMVNQSRVFALDGGDIMVWSQHGNIDAGRGAKSALAVPTTQVSYDSNGNVKIEFPAAIAGSGIRNAAASPGVKPGSVTLAAPQGVVIANDAGIESAGDIVIPGAVSGRDNISAGGSKVGDLNIQPPAISSAIANAGNASGNAAGQDLSEATQSATPLADSALAFLEVEVLGFGSAAAMTDVATGSTSPADVTTADAEDEKSRKKDKGNRLAKEKDDGLPVAIGSEKPAGSVATTNPE